MVDHSGDSNNMVEPVTTTYKLPFEQRGFLRQAPLTSNTGDDGGYFSTGCALLMMLATLR
jgi:hypothetical protein